MDYFYKNKFCANSVTEEEYTSTEEINHKDLKCSYDKSQKICKEEKKLFYENEDGVTKDICSSVNVSESNKICTFDNETNSWDEFYIIRNDVSNNINKYFIM